MIEPMPGKTYTARIALRWGDMDALRHINNTQFVRVLEEARIHWIGDVFTTRRPGSLLVARHVIEYTAQLPYQREPVAVQMWITRMGGSSFDVACVVKSPDEQTVHAIAETTLVYFDPETGASTPMEAEVREILEEYLGDPVPFRRS